CIPLAGITGKDNITLSNVTTNPSPPTRSYNKIVSLQKEIDELLKGNSSANVSSFINSLANATKPGNEITLTAKELSASVKMLVQLVNYNSLVNNSAVNTITDHQNIVQVASNLLEEENTPTWLYLQESRSNVTDDLLKAMDDFGSQVGSQLDAGLENLTYLVIRKQNIVFRVDLLTTRKKLSMDLSHYGAKIFVPGEAFALNSTTQASTIVYKTLNNILTLEKEGPKNEEKNGRTKFKSGSSIVSATILPPPITPMGKPIKFVFYHKNKSEDVIGSCVFWQIGLPQRTWLTRGCVRVEHESSERVTTCQCDHLTIFAVLMNNKRVKPHHELYLKSIATIGCACSLLFLLLTFMLTAWLWKYLKSPRVKMILHLCIAIAATCILIMINENFHLGEVWCTAMAALLHYFLLCVFTWMFNHGVLLYLLIIKADLGDNIHSKMKWFYTFGWGFPCTVVGMSLIVTGIDKYVAENCWLTLEHNILYCAFVAPAAMIVLVNSVLFITLLCRINRVSKFRESMTRVQHVKAWLRRSLILLPVLGITWSFGLLTFISSTTVFHYLFTIFNSLQGFVIFFNFCVLDSEVRARVVGALCKKKHTSAGCVRNKAVAEPISIEDNVHKNNNLQAPAVIFLTAVPARIQGIENKRFLQHR
ncbi:adhesion G protein-coupled receptor L3-like, partial [Porites lutea]|uniref:adhesion G protein-coupled receptor L3-like n=1 Tax=Porites lutea TaxID=51062 RepID=UPI003CC5E8D2